MEPTPTAPAHTGDPALVRDVKKRRTFAIISHPDAGKTTLTEKLLLFGGAIQMAGTVKAKKSGKFATSDWMAVEQERGISVASSVMQFSYDNCVFNLLDTPGHKDFSEDTYRVLTAVDAAIMVVDAAKGVEEQTIKLLEVCRLRDTPIITFINKMDREVREPLELLDEIESILKIHCAPVTWPIGMGKRFQGVYHLHPRRDPALQGRRGKRRAAVRSRCKAWARPSCANCSRWKPTPCCREIELVRGAGATFNLDDFLAGKQTPVFFGSGDQQLRRARSAARAVRLGALTVAARGQRARRRPHRAASSPASCSRSRPTWTRSTATASPSSASAPAATRPT